VSGTRDGSVCLFPLEGPISCRLTEGRVVLGRVRASPPTQGLSQQGNAPTSPRGPPLLPHLALAVKLEPPAGATGTNDGWRHRHLNSLALARTLAVGMRAFGMAQPSPARTKLAALAAVTLSRSVAEVERY
jgi:hypothetical protein